MKRLIIITLAVIAAFGIAYAAEIEDLDTTDGNNTGRFPENMAPSAVNDGMRATEGLLARFYNDLGCRIKTTGTGAAYALNSQGTSSYYDGLIICFESSITNTGALTLNLDSLGAQTVQKWHDQDLVEGDIETLQKVLVVYDGTNFQVLSTLATAVGISQANTFREDQTIQGDDAGAGLVEGPTLDIDRNSGSPAADDFIGGIQFFGRTDADVKFSYANMAGIILDPTTGTEDSAVGFSTRISGTSNIQATLAQGLFMTNATGGDQGVGTINATAIFDDGVQLESPSVSGEAKAWVNFSAVAAIIASFNVTSITDQGVGDWTVTLTTAMSTSSYAVLITAQNVAPTAESNNPITRENATRTKSTTVFHVGCFTAADSPAAFDCANLNAAAFGDQ